LGRDRARLLVEVRGSDLVVFSGDGVAAPADAAGGNPHFTQASPPPERVCAQGVLEAKAEEGD
jgi:hypothetical protein